MAQKLRVNLQEGINYIDFSYERSLVLDKILVTNYEGFTPRYLGGAGEDCELTPPPMATDQNTFWLEGECAEVGENWSKTSDPAASGGQAVVVSGRNAMEAPPADVPANLIRFTVEQADSGSYNLFARIKAPSGYDDSYYVRANGGEWFKWAIDIRQGSGFVWNQIPTAFSLHKGTNTLDFAYREDGTLLDKVYLTTTAEEPVSGSFGETVDNCGGEIAAVTRQSAKTDELASTAPSADGQVSLFPNPVSSRLTFSIESPRVGEVRANVTDNLGRLLQTFLFEKQDNVLQAELDLSALPPGMYYLRIFEKDHQTTRSFIKN